MKPEYPPLDLTIIRQQLSHSPIGHTLHYYTTVPSTMPIAAELAQEPGTPSGLIVVAEEQTSGRGRRGRRWQAPYGSALLVTIVLKPPYCQLPAPTLTMLAGNALLAAVAEVVPALSDESHLKWPNDLVLGSDAANAAKVAGILAESALSGDGAMRYALLGIGINVNQLASDLPRIAPPTPRPTSLRVAAGRITQDAHQDGLIDRTSLLVLLCRHLSEGLSLAPAATYQLWKSHLSTLGQTVAVYMSGPEQGPALIGQAIDVQEDGALVVVDQKGAKHTFHAADISVRITP